MGVNETANDNRTTEELKAFEEERERLRSVLGGIGGARQSRKDTMVNGAFIFAVAVLLIHDLIKAWGTGVNTMLTLELGVFLVSFKIIYMMHQNAKVNHFQFWVLNTIEFRLNSLEQNIRKLAKSKAD